LRTAAEGIFVDRGLEKRKKEKKNLKVFVDGGTKQIKVVQG
jgi:hypothetical protein